MTPRDDPADAAALIAALNDLLQLEQDALPAYALALGGLRDAKLRLDLEAFRQDHLRHVGELTGLIRARGGLPIPLPHVPTGLLKLAVQASGLPGGDGCVLLAFRANEWQSREKYARAAAARDARDPEVAAVLRRAAADEARHYAWAVEALGAMGLGDDTPVGAANEAFARLHGATAGVIEAAGRAGLEALARAAPRPIAAA
jgi:rubrerythrin